MTVIQCDKCKSIIETGQRVRLEHGDIRPYRQDEEREGTRYAKLTTKELDLCNECYKTLKEFLEIKE